MSNEDADLTAIVSRFAETASKKLNAIGVHGEPEDQIRGPLETLIADIADHIGVGRSHLVLVGESSIADLKTRPDYAVQVTGALVGFIEVKAPGKGADPRRFKDRHDRDQWTKLKSLPNLMYTDGNEFSLWRSGELVLHTIHLDNDITTPGCTTASAAGLDQMVGEFLGWEPLPPRTPKQLADVTARLCRLLRDEVAEQIEIGNPVLSNVAGEWRNLLFPDANTETFADGYAQAVTFGLLVARARGISLAGGIDAAAQQIGASHSLIGGALYILTTTTATQNTLKTSIGTLTRVLEVVDWDRLSRGNNDAWLYFYEEFLSVYDKDLRKKTGSYYTPPQVVTAMVSMVDHALKTRFGRPLGFATHDVTVIDPAVGTGTFLLAVLRQIADTVATDQGPGSVSGALEDALARMIGFEIQLGPFAVAQLRLLAELADLEVDTAHELRMYVTDTLANPYVEDGHMGLLYESIAESRRKANVIKKDQPVMVVIGNPPYKEKAKGRGAWIESGNPQTPEVPAPFAAWIPPSDWGVGAHAKHLRNLYIYFWRWATWKVFDHDRTNDTGIVCFITVAGFLNGPGFQRMRDYMRRTCDELWVIDCSPDGHQPEVSTRIFQGVQQPVCIVIASRSNTQDTTQPAVVRHRALPTGHREIKFHALAEVNLDDDSWTFGPTGWRDPFLPAATGEWPTYPTLNDLFIYDGSGVMPGRTWVIAPDEQTLNERWTTLVAAKPTDKEDMFHPHLRNGQPGDKHVHKTAAKGLAGHEHRALAVAADSGPPINPIRFAYRSFDRQWIIPDARVINQPNPGLWEAMSPAQVHLTVLHRTAPKTGPGLTATACIPDLDHYKGSFGGRAIPLWLDHAATHSNVQPKLVQHLSTVYDRTIAATDVFAYIVGITAHPEYTRRFQDDLATPGLRIPITADCATFETVSELGYRSLWAQTYGERFANPAAGRPIGKPRLPADRAPRVPADGAISTRPGDTPDAITYDPATHRLHIGTGHIDNVTPAMWAYNTSGMNVISQWFSYRRANRERPVIGDRRPPSPLERIQPDRWLHVYTTDLIDMLNVLGILIDMEADQAAALTSVCDGAVLTLDELTESGALMPPNWYPTAPYREGSSQAAAQTIFDVL